MQKVLIVDDESTTLSSLTMSLEERGFDVQSSRSAVHALQMIVTDRYDYLITDIHIPWMSGYRLAAIVSRVRPRVDIILMSAEGFPVDYTGFPHLTKPFGVSKLLSTMKKCEIERNGGQVSAR